MAKTEAEKREYRRNWRLENADMIRERNRAYYAIHKEERSKQAKAYYLKSMEYTKDHSRTNYAIRRYRLHELILEKLGSKCRVCGFSDTRALHVDHVNGGGNKERKQFTSQLKYYKFVLDNIDSGKYQILCANCNWIKRVENKENVAPRVRKSKPQ